MPNLARPFAGGATVLALIIGAGCGDDDSTTPATTVTTVAAVTSTVAAPTSAPTRQLRLLGIGDGVMAVGQSDGTSFVDQFAEQLEATHAGLTVEVTNLGNGTETAGSVLDVLEGDLVLRDRVAAADIIVLSVGGNDSDPFAAYPAGTSAPDTTADACLQAYAPQFSSTFESILTEIEALRGDQPTSVRLLSDYNPFIGLSEAPNADFGVQFFRQVVAAQAGALCAIADRHDGQCIPVYQLFSGADGTSDPAAFLESDHVSLGPAGLSAIADALAAIGIPELTS